MERGTDVRLFWAKGTGGWLIAIVSPDEPSAKTKVGVPDPVAFAEDPSGRCLEKAQWMEKDANQMWRPVAARICGSSVAVGCRVLDRTGPDEGFAALPVYVVEFTTSACA
jgi:hypothetical protein